MGATADVGPGFNKNDFSSFDQTNDYSYNSSTAFSTVTTVTVYLKGMLVYGTGPDVSAQSGSGMPSTMGSTSFRRSTEANPALAARAAASTPCLAGQHPKTLNFHPILLAEPAST